MNELKKLIEQLCPDGVQYEPFSEVIKRERLKGRSCPDISRVYSVTNEYGVVASDDYRINQVASADTSNYTVIRPGMFAYNPSRIDVGSIGKLADDAVSGLVSPLYVVFSVIRESLDLRFVELFIGSSYVHHCIVARREVGARNRFDFANWKQVMIPIPPIEVQREVVRILDSMQELDDALSEEHALVTDRVNVLRAMIYGASKYPRVPLGDIGEFERGRRFTRAEMNGSGVGCVHYGDIYTEYGFYAAEPVNRLDESIEKNLRYASKGDVIVAATSENAEDVCTAMAWLGEEDVAIHDDCQRFRHGQNPLYMAMFFNSEPFARQKQRFITESKVVRIAGNEMAQIEIPLPPLEKQNEIASGMMASLELLDAIEEELQARRKQFEYYRDRLLDFPEKVA